MIAIIVFFSIKDKTPETAKTYGTGSYPPLQKGLHLNIRLTAK